MKLFNDKKFYVFLLIAAIFVLSYFNGKKYIETNIKDEKFKLELAETEDQRKKGLSHRDGICDNCGMIFIFDKKGEYGFWMKDMRFGLDIVWISNAKVVHMEKNIPPDFTSVLRPTKEADMVLEIKAGKADELGLKIGDEINF